ncbi:MULTISPECIES: Hpt domain-containing protein [Ramlibacter]|uniref:Hpt domain-containing protein n=1 Tax=Ramlibacter aquaticus TaxID=2780094 RepID=A0ABR9SJ21_9BURK|nr:MULTISPECIES: Hpt domain-containing protein [Ramlibacter]MBE7942303.1 Hpt domain-containing protein [Ramlibacter aquaticus]
MNHLPAPDLPHFEPDAAAARLGGRPDFLRQVLVRFLQQGPRLLAEAQAACPQAPDAVRRALHTLAGAGATCGATALAAGAAALSHAAAEGRLEAVQAGLPALQREMQACIAEATRWAELEP